MGLIYPKLTRVREVSVQIAARVIHVAQEEVCLAFSWIRLELILCLQHVDRNAALRSMDDSHLHKYVQTKAWMPNVANQ